MLMSTMDDWTHNTENCYKAEHIQLHGVIYISITIGSHAGATYKSFVILLQKRGQTRVFVTTTHAE